MICRQLIHLVQFYHLFILFYLLGANQKEHTCQMVCKEMRDQYNVERVYVLHEICQA